LTEPLPGVLAAGILMEQVIYNLVHNAIRLAAAQAQPGQVTIRTHADANLVWVEVLDGEHGLDKEQDRAIDEPCMDLADGELGIGLSISRSIVGSYQGEISCRRRENGSQVSFSLPKMKS